MDWRNALAIVVQVARAIQHAHEHGVVHRDLKPANIMLLDRAARAALRPRARRPRVKIMDFGFARLESLGQRLTRTGQSFGTPLYMSPEQALGQRSDRPLGHLLDGLDPVHAAPGPALVRSAEPPPDREPASSMTTRRISRSCDPTCPRRSTPCWAWRWPRARRIATPPPPTWPTISKTSWPAGARATPCSPVRPPRRANRAASRHPTSWKRSSRSCRCSNRPRTPGRGRPLPPRGRCRRASRSPSRAALVAAGCCPPTAVAVWAVLAAVMNRAARASGPHDIHDHGAGRTHDHGSDGALRSRFRRRLRSRLRPPGRRTRWRPAPCRPSNRRR